MYKRRVALSITLIMMVSVLMLAVLPSARSAQFVIASWDYPDEYGQGIGLIYVWHNVSGSWVEFPQSPIYPADSTTFGNVTTGENLKLEVYSYLNRSYIGFPEPWNQGHNYIRHSVTVAKFGGEIVFSQQNFTYTAFGGTADPVEWYKHTIILDFLPVYGEVYTVTVTYEVCW